MEELRLGLRLLQIIGEPFESFKKGYREILEYLETVEESKRVDFQEEMEDYIFQSRREERELLEEEIMGRQKLMTLYERALEEGIEQGLEKGFPEGIEQGIEKGIEKGLEIGLRDTARKMKEKGFTIGEIVELTGLTESQIREI